LLYIAKRFCLIYSSDIWQLTTVSFLLLYLLALFIHFFTIHVIDLQQHQTIARLFKHPLTRIPFLNRLILYHRRISECISTLSEPLQAGWVVHLCQHKRGDQTPPCIWAGVDGKCGRGFNLNTEAYDHPIAIMDTRRARDGRIELDFVAVSTETT
jgi:hypothetical protein